jgi:uncharacterized protein
MTPDMFPSVEGNAERLRLVRTLLEEQRLRWARRLVRRDLRFSGVDGKIDVAIGMRRSGKTCALVQAMQDLMAAGMQADRIFYVSMDDDRLGPLDAAAAAELLDGFYQVLPENHERRCHLLLDEVHVIEGWSRLVRRLHDTKDAKLWLTGSSAKLLSQEIATELRGRSLATTVWPYSFREWLRARGQEPERPLLGRPSRDRLSRQLEEYLSTGGFPEIVELDTPQRIGILQNYVDVVVFRDVVERHQISNLPAARYLTRLLLRNIARPFSVHKAFSDLRSQGRRISKDTLYQYQSYFEDAFLCFSMGRFGASSRKSEVLPRKVFAVDPGLAAAFFPAGTMDIGRRFENLIYLDLRRQGAEVGYYLTKAGQEVDFVATWPDGRGEVLQVCWDLADASTRAREEAALAAAEQELGWPGVLLTPDSYLERVFGDGDAAEKRQARRRRPR